ncbi:hypothetical protein [Halomonas lysinitropha]|uniref:hypothetical protein n=1 Tax=Halomonas lysinitropha TaxID=2607506 RepID=UPI001249EE73|nr:hypothetical protein [Halomonas lysinitropha]
MKLTVYASALVITLLFAPTVMAEDSVYLEERMKRLHEKAVMSTMIKTATSTRAQLGTMVIPATRTTPATVVTPDPWWR